METPQINAEIAPESQEASGDQEARCTCNDAYATALCPIHFSPEAVAQMKSQEVMVITDADMVEGQVRRWEGYAFTCRSCGQDAIMFNMKHCGNCGTKVQLQSDLFTAQIRALQERIKNGRLQ